MQTRPMTRIMRISGNSFIHSFASRDPASSPWEQLRWGGKYGQRQPAWGHFQIKYIKTQWATQGVSQSQSSVGAKADSSSHCFLGHPQPPTTIGYCSGRVLSALTRTIFFFFSPKALFQQNQLPTLARQNPQKAVKTEHFRSELQSQKRKESKHPRRSEGAT